MEILAFLLILGAVLIGLKLLSLIFRTGVFLISLPFQIIAACIMAIIIFLVLPVTLITGLLATLLLPVGILAPFLLVGFGIYLLARR